MIIFFKKQKYDLIQANSTPQFKAVIAAFILRIKIVWIIEDSYFPSIIVFLFRFLSKLTNCKIIYTSRRVYDFYLKDKKILKNNIKEIFAPVDTTKFNPDLSFSIPEYIDKKKKLLQQ